MQQELEYIYQVYLERNFSKAAQKLFVSQPALSMAVQRKEEELGMPLFDRSTRPLTLTAAGEAYIEYIEKLRAAEEDINGRIADLKSLKSGHVRIGGTSFINVFILPRVLTAFAADYPGVTVELVEAGSDKLAQLLEDRELDLSFSCDEEIIEKYESFPAFDDQILLAVPKVWESEADAVETAPAVDSAVTSVVGAAVDTATAALSAAVPIDAPKVDSAAAPIDAPKVSSAAALAPQPFFALAHRKFILLTAGNNLRKRTELILKEINVQPESIMEVSQLLTAKSLVAAGMGASFVSDRMLEASDAGLHFYPVTTDCAQRHFRMLVPKQKYTTAAAKAFIREFQAIYIN